MQSMGIECCHFGGGDRCVCPVGLTRIMGHSRAASVPVSVPPNYCPFTTPCVPLLWRVEIPSGAIICERNIEHGLVSQDVSCACVAGQALQRRIKPWWQNDGRSRPPLWVCGADRLEDFLKPLTLAVVGRARWSLHRVGVQHTSNFGTSDTGYVRQEDGKAVCSPGVSGCDRDTGRDALRRPVYSCDPNAQPFQNVAPRPGIGWQKDEHTLAHLARHFGLPAQEWHPIDFFK